MIGNDIVDLQVAARESNWKRPGLSSKIFSESEKEIMQLSEDPEQFFWLFWAMKEAAYKAHQRRFLLPRRFNPKAFQCTIDSSVNSGSSGNVQINNYHYHTTVQISEKTIHCVAFKENSEVKKQIFQSKNTLKQELISAIANQSEFSSEGLKIEKDSCFVPHLFFQEEKLKVPFSISAHGQYSAYVFAVNSLLKTS